MVRLGQILSARHFFMARSGHSACGITIMPMSGVWLVLAVNIQHYQKRSFRFHKFQTFILGLFYYHSIFMYGKIKSSETHGCRVVFPMQKAEGCISTAFCLKTNILTLLKNLQFQP